MSPLTDVTNTAGHDAILGTQYVVSQKRGRPRTSRSCPRIPCLQSQGESDIAQSHKSFKRKSEPVAIKMCNTQFSNQERNSTHSQGLNSDCLCSNHQRNQSVTPIRSPHTDILLSQAVETLSLSQTSVKSSSQTDIHSRQGKKKLVRTPEKKSKVKNKVVASCNGLPETPNVCESGTAPQQCGACGLEFTSVPVLTVHLARHVYDGLYAAQWLTQAMQLVASRQPPDGAYSHNDRNSINNDSQNSCVD